MAKPAPLTYSISPASIAQLEGSSGGTTAYTFTVTRSSGSGKGSVVYTVTAPGAGGAQASDFVGGVFPSGTINFRSGQTSAQFTVPVAADTVVEGDESFTVTLSNPSKGTITTGTATGAIQNDDAAASSISITAADAAKPEGDTGTTPFTFTVSRTGATVGDVTANYTVTGAGVDQANAADFAAGAMSGAVTIPDGQASTTLTIDVNADTTVEPDEGFTVTLSNPTGGAQIGTGAASGTIQNDDFVIQRVSVSSSEGEANNDSLFPAISAGGRYITFQSAATNLVAGDGNGFWDIFVRDLVTGETERASLSTSGAEAAGGGSSDNSTYPSISADGRYVAFATYANNFASGDTNGSPDVFLRDRGAGATSPSTTLVSGVAGAPVSGGEAAISANGGFVAFTSTANNLTSGDTGADRDVFVWNRQTGAIQQVSVNGLGLEASGATFTADSRQPSISADGNRIAFVSTADNLSSELEVNVADPDVFVRDRTAGTTTQVNATAGNGAGVLDPSISADGNFVAFAATTGDRQFGPGFYQIYVRNLQTGVTEQLTQSIVGSGRPDSLEPAISANGRYVAFTSYASDLVANDTNGGPDVFVYDRVTDAISLVSKAANGAQAILGDGTGGPPTSDQPSISDDGRYVSFRSTATNLVPNDNNLIIGSNSGSDIFVVDGLQQGWWVIGV